MARFRYKGPIDKPKLVKKWGDMTMIRLHKQDGTVIELTHPSGKFPPGQDIGHDILDDRSIRYLSADPRFERIS